MSSADNLIKNCIGRMIEACSQEELEISGMKETLERKLIIEEEIKQTLREKNEIKLFFELEELEIKRETMIIEFYCRKILKIGANLLFNIMR